MATNGGMNVHGHYVNHHLNVINKFYRNLNPVVATHRDPQLIGAPVKTLSLSIPIFYQQQDRHRPGHDYDGHDQRSVSRIVNITIYIPKDYPFAPLATYITNLNELFIRPSNEVNYLNGRINVVAQITDRSPGQTFNHDLIDYVKFIVPWVQTSDLIYHQNVTHDVTNGVTHTIKLFKCTKCTKIHQPRAKCLRIITN